jgi:hypothetical protein
VASRPWNDLTAEQFDRSSTLGAAMSEVAVKLPLPVAGSTRRRVAHRDHLAIWLALFAAAALISAFTILQGIDPFDEGLTLAAARRVAEGQLPYRDFLWAYGPAQPYLLAGLWKLFGGSLLDWRIIRVLADAGVSLTAYALVRRRAHPALAGAVWLAVAGEMAEPRSANPFPLALLAVLLALAVATGSGTHRRRVGWAAALTVVAAAFRVDFALYGLAAVAIALALSDGLRPAIAYVALTAVLTVLLYTPFLVLDGPAHVYHALIGVSLADRGYWTLPFPLAFHAAPGAGAAKTVKHLIDFYVPALTVVGFGLGALAALARRRAPLESGLVVFGLGALSYLLSRTDEFHVQPLFVVAAILLGLALAGPRRPLLAVVPAAVLALLLTHAVANRVSAAVSPPAMATLSLPVADGVQAPPAEARALERVVSLVDARVPPERPIFAAAQRADLVRLNDPLLYVLTNRDNPTYEDFGLEAGAAAQRRIVARLARIRPGVIVRWTDPASSAHEPNLRGRPTGVHTLDRWIGSRYRLLARLYHYDVLTLARG